ncbi:MAG: hypothetical protein ACKV22_38700 [Bryobacteraceae bacterium]
MRKARVVLIGVAQEKASVWKSWPRKGQEKARHPHMDWGREMAYINHFYFYLWDSEWGAAFWKTNAYAPWPIWLWLNGHEWAKRQLEKVGIADEALDNGFRSCSDAAALQKICARLGPGAVQSFFRRWWRRPPSPFTDTDVRAGYGYQMSSRQFEVADTCVFDRPLAGRMWFEGVIRDHLDVGRPDQIALIFHRRVSSRTPGTFRTRVISRGVAGCGKSQRMPAPFRSRLCILNRQVVECVGALLQSPNTSRQATYDLRRLRRKGLIAKIAGTQRYQLASLGRLVAVLFTKTYDRAPGLSALDSCLPDDVAARSSQSTAWRGFERESR